MKTVNIVVFSLLLWFLSHTAWTQELDDHDGDSAHEHVESEHDDHDEHEEHDDHEEHGEHEDHEEGEEHGDHDEHGHSDGASLSQQKLDLASIRVETLQPQKMNFSVYAPGEVKANGYTSYVVSPRVDSVVLQRHVALGDHVEKNQKLVTLFSEVVADAQAAYRIADAEWQRVKKLGRGAVGENRYVTAESEYKATQARLLAYGLSLQTINASTETASALGEYTLLAANEAVVLSDDFHQGQRVEAGQWLMDLADEHELWVEAQLSPTRQFELPRGAAAVVTVGDKQFHATVTQEAHTIDPQTRTRIVRLLIHNEDHRLHPGLFADVSFSFTTEEPVLAVPEAALMRSADGDWVVYVEQEPGEFTPVEVTLGRSLGAWREITGIDAGSRVAVEGAFFIASEIAKGGFDPHNH